MDNFSQFYEQFLTERFNVTSVDRLNLTLLSGLKSEHPEHKESDFFHVQNLGGEDYYIALPGGSLGVRTNNGDIVLRSNNLKKNLKKNLNLSMTMTQMKRSKYQNRSRRKKYKDKTI